MRRFNEAKIRWISRVPETSTEAKAVVEMGADKTQWQNSEDGQTHWFTQTISLPQGQERWVVVRTEQGEARAQATLTRQVAKAERSWKQKLWHLSNRHFACEADAQSALARARELKGLPMWLEVQSELVSSEHHAGKGRPRKDATPTMHWHIQTTVSVKQPQVEQEARRKACFIVATNVLDSAVLSDQELVTTYKEQGSVERGFRFLKDPLFLASSVFLKKPERIVALGLIMVLCGARSIVWPNIGCAHVWPKRSKPFPISSTDQRLVLPCAGSFSVLRALSSCISTQHPRCSRSSYVCSPCIASSWLCSDLRTKKSTPSLLETAKCERLTGSHAVHFFKKSEV